jgi:predicted NBD/HSP70 family sugar kinase
MKHLGIDISLKNTPVLDPQFIPMGLFNKAFLKTAKKPVSVAVERENGQVATVHTFIHGTAEMAEADTYYIDRLVKSILWMKGGFRVFITDKAMCQYLQGAYCAGGSRQFDADFMAKVYEQPFQILLCDTVPEEKGASQAIGRHLGGCRIGFDAGGSDRKVSAVIDGEAVYSEETVWFPKLNSDPDYHYNGIVAALKAAAAKMPRVDAVGVSSAGIYIDNQTMVASLFLQVPKDAFKAKVRDIYIRAVRDTFGPDVPLVVANDGDVSALAGAMGLGENNVLGMAMGTSEAVGFVDAQGCITGWLNELAFMPVDANPEAMEDEWSGDIGCGVKYFSQDSVIKLAPRAGIELDENLSPAEKLKVVQGLMAEGDERAAKVYESIGVYLGHTLAYYHDLYTFKHVLLLGRVMSGKGGDLLLEACRKVLAEEYPTVSEAINLALPDEKFRRVGQSMAAASLAASKQ